MPQKNDAGRYRFLALLWTLAALSMVVGIIKSLPGIAPLPALVLGLSVLCAINWWAAYFRAKKSNK